MRLELIGDNNSRAAALHRFAGKLVGLDVAYDLFVPPDLGRDFDQVSGNARRATLGVRSGVQSQSLRASTTYVCTIVDVPMSI